MISASGLLRTKEGRLRLGWRLLGFLALAALVAVPVGAFTPAGVVGGAVALLAGAVLSGWWWLRVDGHDPAALGFHLSADAPLEAGKGLLLGVLIALLVVAFMAVLGGVRWAPDDGAVSDWATVGATSLLFLALPAIAEEALLRGYPLQALAEAWGNEKALLVTSVAFGLLHLGNPGAGALSVANVAVAGLLLGVVYVRTVSLWWASGVHLGWNWAHGFLADMPVSGLDVSDTPLYDGVTGGPTWIGGGTFGPEGSVVATVVVMAATVALWKGPWLTPGLAARAAQPLIALPTNEELQKQE